MLNAKNAVATIAVKDLSAAGKFYEETLGLKKIDKQGEEALTFQSGNSKLFVYRSQFAGTNQATTVTWTVGSEIEEIVRTLKAKGVTFEHYDMPGMTRTGDIHGQGEMKAAWFKDPDGNIIGLVSG
ncbi:MAG TPA: VOC family protein [Candidatus Kapabacteria bacterium]|nr:VOC family protein [Candidatus Kapabacteria bacterium]